MSQAHSSFNRKTSYAGEIESSIGGVGHNVALAALYAGANVRLVSEVGHDHGDLLDAVSNEGLELSGITTNEGKRTARYVSMNDGTGELLIACADMDIIKDMSPKHVYDEICRADAECVFFDGNIGNDQKMAVIRATKRKTGLETGTSTPRFVGFEPTSVPKSSELAAMSLGVYPNHDIDLATPNIDELQTMFESFHEAGRFDVDHWFPVIDALGVNETLRLGLENLARSKPELINLIRSGIAQQALHLLPYIPNLMIKSGVLGVLSFQLLDADQIRDLARFGPSVTNNTVGKSISTQIAYREGQLLGVLVQHYPAFDISPSEVVSVSGAGDSFCGVLVAKLAKDTSWLYTANQQKADVIDAAQLAASLAIQTLEAVNPEIRSITI
ncbi:hypothetical protein AWJ20_1192 [Sugiyamaella lignohabitans]|uniref:Carbohydrate kinase PfkB domain-containing protein n=1 Tax=Sugiyamaella lignohabitans TaxID=796027 RepID=A0A167DH59_9ASCO|nr:uncharacterized protein AWJ20_1192 [Sugiyamaella lignohabitans]ANB12914.1 hypothetical protein AWJ20_1192 [Sugiyamaella lignohabitans]